MRLNERGCRGAAQGRSSQQARVAKLMTSCASQRDGRWAFAHSAWASSKFCLTLCASGPRRPCAGHPHCSLRLPMTCPLRLWSRSPFDAIRRRDCTMLDLCRPSSRLTADAARRQLAWPADAHIWTADSRVTTDIGACDLGGPGCGCQSRAAFAAASSRQRTRIVERAIAPRHLATFLRHCRSSIPSLPADQLFFLEMFADRKVLFSIRNSVAHTHRSSHPS